LAILSYKCPDCGGPLKFSADTQAFHCEYCRGDFARAEPERTSAGQGRESSQSEPEPSVPGDAEFAEKARLYSCPSCGAEIITGETTAASTCCYCHNPVVLSGRLTDEFRPDKIIPFTISKEKAVEEFKEFCRKRKFLPKEFFSPELIENIRGVYYPYYLVAARAEGNLRAEGKNVKTWRSGDTEYTETTVYDVKRDGEIFVDGISLSAIKDYDQKMLKYVCPYNDGGMKDFRMPFLSGFEAEKRDLGRDELRGEVSRIVGSTSAALLRSTIGSYNSVNVKNATHRIVSDRWDYALFPVWVMNYKFNGGSYIFAMNGQTGKLFGKLPPSKGKLAALFGGVFAAVFALLFALFMLGGGPL